MKTNWIKMLALLLAGLMAPAVSAAEITVKGSDTMVALAQKWAEIYSTQHPDVKIQVTGGGSGVGLAALESKQTDLANASRKIKAKEIEGCIKAFAARPKEYAVALDGLSVYVNAENPINELSLEQLSSIFTGKVKNWKELGGSDTPIVLYSRENSSGTYEFFREHVLKGQDFASSAQTLQGTAQIISAVTKDVKGIGYGGAGYGKGAKHLKVSKVAGEEAIEPSEENVLSGKYPISRSLYVYLNPAIDKDAIKAYLQWIRSDDGQKVVKEMGYFPLPPHLRKS
ncbi:MAG TPA: phosphate ABC transporter substrate-binding protein [Candidatus Limnocylindria bacterium]|nr:phosphate ABC transporter substrate-binding protein [Candidatus Limnocylindria bacterium]